MDYSGIRTIKDFVMKLCKVCRGQDSDCKKCKFLDQWINSEK